MLTSILSASSYKVYPSSKKKPTSSETHCLKVKIASNKIMLFRYLRGKLAFFLAKDKLRGTLGTTIKHIASFR